jgi:hypothetical protein
MGTVGTHAINPALYPKMPYDHVKDFAPVTLVAGVPNVLVMNPAKAEAYGITSVPDLDPLREGQPRQAEHGQQRQRHLDPPGGRVVQDDDRHLHAPLPVPGFGPGAARPHRWQHGPDVRQPASAMPHIKAGKLKALAVTSVERSGAVPELPTVAEAGGR